MFDLQLRLGHRDAAFVQALRHFALLGGEQFAAGVLQRAHRDHRQARVDLHARHRVAGAGANERLLEIGMRDRFGRADEARAELHARRTHVEIARDRLAAADAAGDEHRHRFGDLGQHLLREHAGRNGADMATGLHALNHQRIDARPDQLLGERQRRREADDLGAALLDRFQRPLGRQAPGEHDMADLVLGAHRDQVEERRVHGDEVHPERLVRQRLRARDLGIEQFGRHRSARDHAEPAGVRHGGDEVALADPRHGARHDRDLAAEERGAARHAARQALFADAHAAASASRP